MTQDLINELRAQCHDALCHKHHDLLVDARILLMLIQEIERQTTIRPNGVNDAKPTRCLVFDGRLSG